MGAHRETNNGRKDHLVPVMLLAVSAAAWIQHMWKSNRSAEHSNKGGPREQRPRSPFEQKDHSSVRSIAVDTAFAGSQRESFAKQSLQGDSASEEQSSVSVLEDPPCSDSDSSCDDDDDDASVHLASPPSFHRHSLNYSSFLRDRDVGLIRSWTLVRPEPDENEIDLSLDSGSDIVNVNGLHSHSDNDDECQSSFGERSITSATGPSTADNDISHAVVRDIAAEIVSEYTSGLHLRMLAILNALADQIDSPNKETAAQLRHVAELLSLLEA